MKSQTLRQICERLLLASGSGLFLLAIAPFSTLGARANPSPWSTRPNSPQTPPPTWQTVPSSNTTSPQWQNPVQPAAAPSPGWTAVPSPSGSDPAPNSTLLSPPAIATAYFEHQTPLKLSPAPKRNSITPESLTADSQGSRLSGSTAEPQSLSPVLPSGSNNSPSPAIASSSLEPTNEASTPSLTASSPEKEPEIPTQPSSNPTPSQSTQNPPPDSSEVESPSLTPSPKYSRSPLQFPPSQLINLETANILPAGSLLMTFGAHIFPKDQKGAGTGLQTYNLSIEGAITDNFQLGLAWVLFDDTLGQSFTNGVPDLGLLVFAPKFKYQFLKNANFSLAVAGSLEIGKFTGSYNLFTPNNLQQTTTTLGGTIQLPFTYNISSILQWHLAPGVVFWPNTINNGGNFYGTFLNLGTGLSFTPIERLTLFADVNVPLTDGNAVNNQGQIFQKLVWAAGATYLHSPTVGVDLYATNALGATPATQTLAFIPNGSQVAAGINLRYTPDFGQKYATSFRKTPFVPLSVRDNQLLFNGLTLTSADTLKNGQFSFQGGIGPNVNLQLAYGLSDNAQLEFLGQQLGANDQQTGNSFKLGVGAKLQFLDQIQGDPFSLSVRGTLEEATAQQSDGVGNFAAELAFLYQLTPQLALTFNPKAGFYSSESIFGAGLGFNYEFFKGIQLIGEVTPILSGPQKNTIWAAGLRYINPDWNAGLDIYGTNGTGAYGIGSLVGQSDNQVSVGVNLLWLLGTKLAP